MNRNEFEEKRDRELADAIEKTMADEGRSRHKFRRFKDYWREWRKVEAERRAAESEEEQANLSSDADQKPLSSDHGKDDDRVITDWYIIPLTNLKDLERDPTVDYERYREVNEETLSSDSGASED